MLRQNAPDPERVAEAAKTGGITTAVVVGIEETGKVLKNPLAKGAEKLAGKFATKKSATKNRVKLRKSTREQIEVNQPRNSSGEMVDPHTGEPLKLGEVDVGHKPGQEWRKRKAMHEERGSTRKEVIETENNPDLYHLEDRTNNRSHRYEEK